MRILGIESSCDETGLAIFDSQQGLLGHTLYSQVDTHLQYGGVVPELAARNHITKILPLLEKLLLETQCLPADITGIAYTRGPGLIGALLVGAAFAKSLALAWGIPSIGIHHMEGHLLAPMLEDPAPAFPFVALLVSGGHTMLVEVTHLGHYRILGESLDDAAGEAFDKTAKLLGLPYPGGPALAALADSGDPGRFRFPRPLTDKPNLNFSFSGLKTHTFNTILRSKPLSPELTADIASAFQEAVVDTLLIKCKLALKQTQHSRLVVAGGVGANQRLRYKLAVWQQESGLELFFPRLEFCTDNGAMIAYAGFQRFKAGFDDEATIEARARWPLDSLPDFSEG